MYNLDFKEGQTYICTKSNEEYWTEGKEYTVNLTTYGMPALPDNTGNNWSATALNLDDNQFKLKEKAPSSELDLNELITLTRIDDTTLYVNINHIAAFYHNDAWDYTIVILSDGTQLDAKDSVESIAKYFS